MKKIYFSFILMGALTFSSCSMDEAPFGKLDDKTAIQKPQTCAISATSSIATCAALRQVLGSTTPTSKWTSFMV